jgi:tol-pal system protein YbgF
MRVLTGQIEGLQFQLTQMQTLLERLQEDNEFRFQQLEGGGLGNNGAAVQSGGDMPSGGLPQDPNAAQDFNANQDLNAPQDLDAPQDLSMPSEGLSDPTGVVVQGEPEVPLGTLPADELAVGTEPGVGQPLDLTFDAGGLVTDADADAQYRAGYDAVVSGDYAFAEDQFRQFIGLFPDHPQAPDATAWLGETLIRRGAFDEAADVLLIGFESYPNSGRAPDLLLKLGIALNGAGERETACRTFGEVSRRFLNLTDAFQSRLRQEMAAASC